MDLGRAGVWAWQLRFGDPGELPDVVAELEELGFGALWIPDVGGDVLAAVEMLLSHSTRATIATGILNVWTNEAADVAARRASWADDWRDRFLLGLGVSHAPLIDREEAGRWRKPLAVMQAYLDGLDGAADPVPADARVLAALGPRMLELSRDRAGGAHPYLAPVEHTAAARQALGADRLLAPEQMVVLERDPASARTIARQGIAGYLLLPNYTNNLRRYGFGDDDLADGGSDRLVDAIVAWGDVDDIARRVREQREAGADHVCVQVLTAENQGYPRDAWRALAPAITP